MLKAVFFDLYGTLIDIHTDETKPSVWKAMAAHYAKYGVPCSPHKLRERYLEAMRRDAEWIRENAPEIFYPEPDLAWVLASLFEEASDPDLIRETARLLRKEAMCHIRCYAGAKELLSALRGRGIKVYLLSNAQRLFTMDELSYLGLLPLFDDIALSSDHAVKKPDPLFFDVLLQKHHLDPDECLMVGNDYRCDIQGAAAAGMRGYYILSGISPRADKERAERGEPFDAAFVQIGMDLKKVRRNLLGMVEY